MVPSSLNAQVRRYDEHMEPQWLTPEEQATWRAYIVSSLLISAELDRQLQRDSNMPVAYYGILVALSEAPKRHLRMGQLAESLGVSQSRLSHAITSLEARGFVERQACANDRRGQQAVLTAAGFAALRAAAPGHVAAVRQTLIDPLSAEQISALREICETLLAHVAPTGIWPWATLETEPSQ